MILVPLPSSGVDIFACVDDVDAVVLSQRWSLQQYVEARSTSRLHRVVARRMGLNMRMKIDHIDGNPLDCRRSNLRAVTQLQNLWNTRISVANTSGFKGVHRVGQRWAAQIRLKRKVTYIGTFDTPEDASDAYEEAARKARGVYHRQTRAVE